MRNGKKVGWCGAAILGAVLLTGCSDDAGSPFAPESVRGGVTLGVGEVGTTVFTVGRSGGRFSLAGGHVVTFEAGALCDPVTSGYGPSTWDLPCTPAVAPITFTAISTVDASGRARVTFSPDVRFVPSQTAPSRVLLQLRDKSAATDPFAALFYCPNGGDCFDESVVDPTMKSKRDSRSGWVFRYVKHFSAYNVSTGRAYTADEALTTDAVTSEAVME